MKITLTNPTAGYNLQAINSNFDALESEFQDKVLYRNNPVGEPNQMHTDLDMNSRRILNLPSPQNQHEAARLKDVQNAISGVSNANLLDYDPAGTGAVAGTVQSKLRELVSVKDFGAVGNGVADDTAAVQAAIVYAETIGASVVFPAGDYDIKMVFVATGGISLVGNGCTITQNHDATNSVTVGGAGQYKVSAGFFVKKDADDVEITGFTFTTDDSSFPSLAAGFGSYFPSIGGQRAARISIHHNKFNGGQDRGIFFQGGSDLSVVENTFTLNGITVHVGFTDNIYFYDSASDTTNKYSPIGTRVIDNTFHGYTSTDVPIVMHMTGASDYTVRGNKLLNLNGTTIEGINLYCNDYGPYSSAGVALDTIRGVCDDNIVTGTFENAIEVRGYTATGHATWNSAYKMDVVVCNNKVSGTGVGLNLERAAGLIVKDNFVSVAGSPFVWAREMVDVQVTGNTFEATAAGTGLTTIYSPANLAAVRFKFSDNKIVTPATDQYAFRTTTAISGLEMVGNKWMFNSDVASCRPVVATLTGVCTIERNTFHIDTDTASIFAFVLGGNSYAGTLMFFNNSIGSSAGTGASSLRAANFFDFNTVNIDSNTMGGAYLIEDTTYSFFTNNRVIAGSANTLSSVDFNNTGRAVPAYVWANGNYIQMPAVLNNPGIRVISNNDATNNTLSKATMNVVVGNSTGTLIQQTTHGVIQTIGNTIINNGAGGTTIGVSGSASNTTL